MYWLEPSQLVFCCPFFIFVCSLSISTFIYYTLFFLPYCFLSLCPYNYTSIYGPIHLSIHLSMHASIHPFFHSIFPWFVKMSRQLKYALDIALNVFNLKKKFNYKNVFVKKGKLPYLTMMFHCQETNPWRPTLLRNRQCKNICKWPRFRIHRLPRK